MEKINQEQKYGGVVGTKQTKNKNIVVLLEQNKLEKSNLALKIKRKPTLKKRNQVNCNISQIRWSTG